MNHLIGATLLASLVILLLGYFLGCLNGSVMVSHFIIKDDVRQHGSGNAGLTNFYPPTVPNTHWASSSSTWVKQ